MKVARRGIDDGRQKKRTKAVSVEKELGGAGYEEDGVVRRSWI